MNHPTLTVNPPPRKRTFRYGEQMPVFALWSAPRSRSTAFFRSVVERGDMLALHEPFWNVQAFGVTEVDGRAFRSAASLLTWLGKETPDAKIFFKETTDHRYEEVLADKRFLADARHTFLIRHPDKIVASYHALWPTMRMEEVGLETMHELHAAVSSTGGYPPVVIDSDDLVTRPEATMAAYCTAVGLPFIPEALHWAPGQRSEWRQSASWHVDASASTGFAEQEKHYTHTVENTEKLARFASHHLPFYRQLHALRIQVGA